MPSDEETCAGGGLGFSKGGGSGGFGAAKTASGKITNRMADRIFMAGGMMRPIQEKGSPQIHSNPRFIPKRTIPLRGSQNPAFTGLPGRVQLKVVGRVARKGETRSPMSMTWQ
jgi:hypothetical protein